MQTINYITDPSDFCRVCRGAKTIKSATGRGTYLVEACWQCGGSGQRSIAVLSNARAPETTIGE